MMLGWATNKLFSDEIIEKPQVSISEFVPSQAITHLRKLRSNPPNPIIRERSELYVSLFLCNYVLCK